MKGSGKKTKDKAEDSNILPMETHTKETLLKEGLMGKGFIPG